MEDCQREMTLDEWMAKLPDFHRANQELTTLRATIEAKDAEIADLKHDTDELIRVRREVIKRADAAEARVKELDQLACDLANESMGIRVHTAALERELAEAHSKNAALREWREKALPYINAAAIDDARKEQS